MFNPVHAKAIQGDLKAVDRCLRIMARRAPINGLDAGKSVCQAVITEEVINQAIAEG